MARLCLLYDALKENGRGDIARAIERAALESDPLISRWLLEGVTKGRPYDSMYGIPCGVDYYYDRRKKLFWNLNKMLIRTDEDEGGEPGC